MHATTKRGHIQTSIFYSKWHVLLTIVHFLMGINTTFPPSSHITVSEKGYSVLHGPLWLPPQCCAVSAACKHEGFECTGHTQHGPTASSLRLLHCRLHLPLLTLLFPCNTALRLCWQCIIRLNSCESHQLQLTKLIKKMSISLFLIPVLWKYKNAVNVYIYMYKNGKIFSQNDSIKNIQEL